jgi:hypothetical protein
MAGQGGSLKGAGAYGEATCADGPGAGDVLGGVPDDNDVLRRIFMTGDGLDAAGGEGAEEIAVLGIVPKGSFKEKRV